MARVAPSWGTAQRSAAGRGRRSAGRWSDASEPDSHRWAPNVRSAASSATRFSISSAGHRTTSDSTGIAGEPRMFSANRPIRTKRTSLFPRAFSRTSGENSSGTESRPAERSARVPLAAAICRLSRPAGSMSSSSHMRESLERSIARRPTTTSSPHALIAALRLSTRGWRAPLSHRATLDCGRPSRAARSR